MTLSVITVKDILLLKARCDDSAWCMAIKKSLYVYNKISLLTTHGNTEMK